MRNRDKEVARYLLDKYGSDKFKVVLERIKEDNKQTKESAKNGKPNGKL